MLSSYGFEVGGFSIVHFILLVPFFGDDFLAVYKEAVEVYTSLQGIAIDG